MGKFRYRTNWRGKLILQIGYEQQLWCSRIGGYEPTVLVWRDAKVEDLTQEGVA
ncbi:MAG: hypothetical protein ACXW1D_00230 [Halobacteriota archaeon]